MADAGEKKDKKKKKKKKNERGKKRKAPDDVYKPESKEHLIRDIMHLTSSYTSKLANMMTGYLEDDGGPFQGAFGSGREVEKEKGKKKRVKRGLTAYNMFVKKESAREKAKGHKHDMKAIGGKWKDLTPEEKLQYKEEAAKAHNEANPGKPPLRPEDVQSVAARDDGSDEEEEEEEDEEGEEARSRRKSQDSSSSSDDDADSDSAVVEVKHASSKKKKKKKSEKKKKKKKKGLSSQ